MFFNAFAIPGYLGLYAALHKENHAYAALALATAFIGVAVFFATNRALPNGLPAKPTLLPNWTIPTFCPSMILASRKILATL